MTNILHSFSHYTALRGREKEEKEEEEADDDGMDIGEEKQGFLILGLARKCWIEALQKFASGFLTAWTVLKHQRKWYTTWHIELANG